VDDHPIAHSSALALDGVVEDWGYFAGCERLNDAGFCHKSY